MSAPEMVKASITLPRDIHNGVQVLANQEMRPFTKQVAMLLQEALEARQAAAEGDRAA